MQEDDPRNEEVPQPLPSASDVRKVVRRAPKESGSKQSSFQNKFVVDASRAEAEYTHITGMKDHYRHKSLWSYFLMFLMFGLVAFQSFLLAMVGCNVWSFKDYKWLLPALLVQNLAQVVGLAVFVVKSLFSEVKRP